MAFGYLSENANALKEYEEMNDLEYTWNMFKLEDKVVVYFKNSNPCYCGVFDSYQYLVNALRDKHINPFTFQEGERLYFYFNSLLYILFSTPYRLIIVYLIFSFTCSDFNGLSTPYFSKQVCLVLFLNSGT